MITAKTSPLYLEELISNKLGLPREELRYLRGKFLEKKLDWITLGRQTVLSAPGLEKILVHLRSLPAITLPEDLDFSACSARTKEEKKAAGELVELTVKNLVANPRLIMAYDPAGAIVKVSVKSSVNFRPKMKLQACLQRAGFYKHEGRCPRFPNRY